jgi:hypothetical protein
MMYTWLNAGRPDPGGRVPAGADGAGDPPPPDGWPVDAGAEVTDQDGAESVGPVRAAEPTAPAGEAIADAADTAGARLPAPGPAQPATMSVALASATSRRRGSTVT